MHFSLKCAVSALASLLLSPCVFSSIGHVAIIVFVLFMCISFNDAPIKPWMKLFFGHFWNFCAREMFVACDFLYDHHRHFSWISSTAKFGDLHKVARKWRYFFVERSLRLWLSGVLVVQAISRAKHEMVSKNDPHTQTQTAHSVCTHECDVHLCSQREKCRGKPILNPNYRCILIRWMFTAIIFRMHAMREFTCAMDKWCLLL